MIGGFDRGTHDTARRVAARAYRLRRTKGRAGVAGFTVNAVVRAIQDEACTKVIEFVIGSIRDRYEPDGQEYCQQHLFHCSDLTS